MPRRLLRVMLCLGTLILVAGCANWKQAKGVMIVTNGDIKVVNVTVENGQVPPAWAPGMVVLFRTTETVKPAFLLQVPVGETGKAGEAYVVTDDYKLRKIGDFDLESSDEKLGNAFIKYR